MHDECNRYTVCVFLSCDLRCRKLSDFHGQLVFCSGVLKFKVHGVLLTLEGLGQFNWANDGIYKKTCLILKFVVFPTQFTEFFFAIVIILIGLAIKTKD